MRWLRFMSWLRRVHLFVSKQLCRIQCGRISYGEARRLAIEALRQAEERRQEEREQEARFWTVMDDGIGGG